MTDQLQPACIVQASASCNGNKYLIAKSSRVSLSTINFAGFINTIGPNKQWERRRSQTAPRTTVPCMSTLNCMVMYIARERANVLRRQRKMARGIMQTAQDGASVAQHDDSVPASKGHALRKAASNRHVRVRSGLLPCRKVAVILCASSWQSAAHGTCVTRAVHQAFHTANQAVDQSTQRPKVGKRGLRGILYTCVTGVAVLCGLLS